MKWKIVQSYGSLAFRNFIEEYESRINMETIKVFHYQTIGGLTIDFMFEAKEGWESWKP